MDNFVIIAPHHKLKTYKVFTLIIVIFNIVFFSLATARAEQDSKDYYTALVACLALTAPLLQYFIFGNKEAGLQNMLGGVFIAGAGWMFMEVYLNGLAMMLIAAFGLMAIRPLRFVFSTDGLKLPGFPPKHISWSAIDNVVIKDDMLTIDFKNNKLIQFSLKEAENAQIDTGAFNHFATKCLSTALLNHNQT